MVMAEKIVFEIRADSDCTTLKTWRKVIFQNVSVCRIVSMANDNCRTFKQNQIMFCIHPWFVEYSRPIVFGEDRLRERGSLPATVFFLIKGNFTSMFLKEMEVWWWQKNRVADYCRFWLYYTQNMKKSHFSKSVCLCVCLSVCVSVCL